MIYVLEKRHEFEGGARFTHWEVIAYERRTPIGILVNGETLKVGTKAQCKEYCKTNNIIVEAR